MKRIILLLIILLSYGVSAISDTPQTTHVVTVVSGETELPIAFLNEEKSGDFFVSLKNNVPAVLIKSNSIYVEKDSIGSFYITLGAGDIQSKVYFDSMSILRNDGFLMQEIPIVVAKESSYKQYDLTIDFDPFVDLVILSNGNAIITPTINVYKLDDDTISSDEVSLEFYVYSMGGELLDSFEQIAYVPKMSSFDLKFELLANYPKEVLLAAAVKKDGYSGLDLSQISLIESQLALSPPIEAIDYSSKIYAGLFIFLLAFVILLSYVWYNKSINYMSYWQNQIENLKKMSFVDSSDLQKLYLQRDALNRAYYDKFISRKTFRYASAEINKIIDELKKRL